MQTMWCAAREARAAGLGGGGVSAAHSMFCFLLDGIINPKSRIQILSNMCSLRSSLDVGLLN